MTETDADAFDRAAAREAELRDEHDRRERRRRARRWREFGSNMEGLAFFAFTLPIHWVIVQRVTGLIIAHMFLVAFCATGAVTAWAKMREQGFDRRAG